MGWLVSDVTNTQMALSSKRTIGSSRAKKTIGAVWHLETVLDHHRGTQRSKAEAARAQKARLLGSTSQGAPAPPSPPIANQMADEQWAYTAVHHRMPPVCSTTGCPIYTKFHGYSSHDACVHKQCSLANQLGPGPTLPMRHS